MEKRLSLTSNIIIGSMLFGLFFGAGNLIFPVHMGQQAGSNVFLASIGFLTTAIGLPFLGVMAIGVSKSNGLFDLASRVHPIYGYIMTILLYFTIGPFFALPRTGTVSFEIGFAPYIPEEYVSFGLLLFTILFFTAALFFSLRPNKILVWVGKILNPLFLIFLAFLVVAGTIHPMGNISDSLVHASYETTPFFKGFTEGYNTMDALASLAFGIIVVQTIKDLGITEPKYIAKYTIKAGFISIVLMGLIYSSLSYLGATSVAKFDVSANGGIALAQIANYYFGSFGSILLALIVTVACLKTAIGLITACSETFHNMFPNFLNYKLYVIIFTIIACLIANIGLTQIIALSIPVLMFLYPLAIALIILGLLSSFIENKKIIYLSTTLCTLLVSIVDGLNAMPDSIKNQEFIQKIIEFYNNNLPFFDLGMGWVIPMLLGLCIGLILSNKK
ncbi:MAG: branched-chain amino acid transport system II carrier protein [Tissierellia bacterium]|nr:branched-chain amino acid transport system II carrier protein [Tissierellia bacterium]